MNMEQMYVTLPAGNRMPMVGLGTWKGAYEPPDPAKVQQAVEAALDCGYRLIDTAYIYLNHKPIGQAIKAKISDCTVERKDIFITSKLGNDCMGSRENVQKCMDTCLKDLELEYIDLFLIHTPYSLKLNDDGQKVIDCDVDFVKTWQYMEELVDEGKAKAIGVSNFNKEQIERISKIARHPISNHQIELHPYMQQEHMVKFCCSKNISVTAYSPFGNPGSAFLHASEEKTRLPMDDPLIVSLAKKYNKSPSQIILRNLIQREIAVVPKSFTPSRIQQNIQVFDFTMSEKDLDAISQSDKGQRLWLFKDKKDHPEYPFKDELNRIN